MCTVTFLPRTDGFVLATNRDERRERGEALPPQVFEVAGRSACAPSDRDAGGTWILATDNGTVLCLVNGSLGSWETTRPDAPSRGLLVRELAREVDAEAMHRSLVSLQDRGELVHNAFRLLIATAAEPESLTRLSFDGQRLRRDVVRGPHVETSSGFDPRAVHDRRSRAFQGFLADQHGPADMAPALDEWHRTHLDPGRRGDVYSVCMHHELARTVSYTRVEVSAARVRMTYCPGPPCQDPPALAYDLVRTP